MNCSTPTNCPSLSAEFAQTHVHWVSDAIQPTHHLLLFSPMPSIFPSIKGFPNESALCNKWPKCWSFTFSITPSNEYSGLIFFMIDWFDPFAVQGNLNSFFQYHSLKASVLQCSAFSMVQLSHLLMTTAKTIALTKWTLCQQSDVSAF